MRDIDRVIENGALDRPLSFLFLVDDHHGHIHALCGVARRLSEAGHQVRFCGPGRLEAAVLTMGFPYLHEPFLSPVAFSTSAPGARRSRLVERDNVRRHAQEAVETARRVFETYRPDLTIFDPFLLCHYPAFASRGARCVTVSTKPLLTPDRLVPPYTSSIVPDGSALFQVRTALAWGVARWRYLAYRTRCLWNEARKGTSHRSLTIAVARTTNFPLRREWATRPLASDLRYRSVPELILLAREFELPRLRPLTGPGAYVGPCVDPKLFEQPWIEPPGDGPLLCCNLGTVERQIDGATMAFFQRLLSAFAREPTWRIVIAAGDDGMFAALSAESALPKSVEVRRWLPLAAVAARADLLITHGGSNSTKEAVIGGTPMLVAPRFADQPGIAARVFMHGLGLIANRDRDGTDVLHGKMVRLLTDACFGKKIGQMRDIFRAYDRKRICERILTAAALGKIPLFESTIDDME